MGLFNLFGTYSQKELKKINPLVDTIEALEESYRTLTDEQLRGKTAEFRARLAQGETLDDLLPEAFATVREAADRVLGMRHFRCQLQGGIVLYQGRISEMRTGEGKTLVATLPSYLAALEGKGVHVVTVNDYLARRDSEWMGKIHTFLGLTVGLITHEMEPADRRKAYAADITYATNNEIGFDYLRDNMIRYRIKEGDPTPYLPPKVQRDLHYAIVDEVDSILIDEARTPLIISGQVDESDEMYRRADTLVKMLVCKKYKEIDAKTEEVHDDCDYVVEEKNKTVSLTPRGVEKVQNYFGIENYSDTENVEIQHYVNQSLRAYGIMERDVDYVVKEGEIIIVDEFTGRLMFGRRYSNGLHQAIEAKENVKVESESKTLASITFQNLFRLYHRLAGMTGTAMTEEDEFLEIYNLDVVEIPTNKPSRRKDHDDRLFKNELTKFGHVLRQVQECHAKGQPVLIGTVTIDKSEALSRILTAHKIPHHVLNAKNHEREAEIIAQAGRKGAVTIATNMAGRGTDIILGGNAEYMAKKQMEKEEFPHEMIVQSTSFAETDDREILAARARYKELYGEYRKQVEAEAEEVKAAGGLFIVGTERHESRRIDNQLRGRAGRQGDVGETVFYISFDDSLIRLFGGEKLADNRLLESLPDDEPITSGLFTKTVENAQHRKEGANFNGRKRVLEYDDVVNSQRKQIYKERDQIMEGMDLSEKIQNMRRSVIDRQVDLHCTGERDDWNLKGLREYLEGNLFFPVRDEQGNPADFLEGVKTAEDVKERLTKLANDSAAFIEEKLSPVHTRELERFVLLGAIDSFWMEHIDTMEDLRQGIGLQAYGSRNPLVEYQLESDEIFRETVYAIRERAVFDCIRLFRTWAVNVLQLEEFVRAEQAKKAVARKLHLSNVTVNDPAKRTEQGKGVTVVKGKKVGPNEPCPCGSGKKYKKCCGRPQ